MDFTNKTTPKLNKKLILSIFLAVYPVVFWLSFSSKGIFVNGHFYKKSANMTTVTYNCRNPFAEYKKIVLQKQFDSSVITVDNKYVITVSDNGSWQQTAGENAVTFDIDWSLISNQSTENLRGLSTNQPYFIVLIFYLLCVIFRVFSAQIYHFIFRNRAAGENYYKVISKVFTIATVMIMVYFILPV